MRDYDSLIPEMRDWNNGDGVDLESWFSCVGSYELIIAAFHLLWPEFIVHGNCVFKEPFTGNDNENFVRLSSMEDVDSAYIEERINRETIIDLFPNAEQPPTLKQGRFIGRLLKDAWECKLKRDIPDREFIVSFPELENDKIEDLEITFFQSEQTAKK